MHFTDILSVISGRDPSSHRNHFLESSPLFGSIIQKDDVPDEGTESQLGALGLTAEQHVKDESGVQAHTSNCTVLPPCNAVLMKVSGKIGRHRKLRDSFSQTQSRY